MRKLTILTVIAAFVAFAAACGGANSNTTATPTGNTPATANQTPTTATTANSNHGANSAATTTTGGDETPALVKAAFPGAQSFTVQHKDISPSNQTQIEKDAGAKIPDQDHHSYLAFSTEGGTRKQIGAATIVKANGTEAIVIYESKDGMPTISEVRADDFPAAFLAQFKGKNHDNKLAFGSEIKPNGADEAAAKNLTDAVRVDLLTMETLYGKPHKH
jgi:hypothetical protein